MKKYIGISACLLLSIVTINQSLAQDPLADLVARLKSDTRGPYKDIRWFCNDGTIKPPREPCGQVGGVQHARYNDEIVALGESRQLYLGQILSATSFQDFWDSGNSNTRLKQYLLEQFLFLADNGWIQQKSQFYRGAIQAEDEEKWGRDFFIWLVDHGLLNDQSYFLIRETYKTLPHTGSDQAIFEIRALAKELSDADPSFMDLRIKIHGKPEASDTLLVNKFVVEHSPRMTGQNRNLLRDLAGKMSNYYRRNLLSEIESKIRLTRANKEWSQGLSAFIKDQQTRSDPRNAVLQGSELAAVIKREIMNNGNTAQQRLALMDISIALEYYIRAASRSWTILDVEEAILKACHLGELSNAAGFLFDWEWIELEKAYTSQITDPLPAHKLSAIKNTLSNNVNWGTGLVMCFFDKTIQQFQQFEPLAAGFFDDRIRNSPLLELGELYSVFSDLEAKMLGINPVFFDIKNARITGLNPGYTKGKLYIIKDSEEDIRIDPKGVYFFQHPPSSLSLVAGLLSIDEGNMVSHIQLLARNLGIPNSNIDYKLVEELDKFAGKEVFYAVAPDGTVILKSSEKMTGREKELFEEQKIADYRQAVPIDELMLEDTQLSSIRDIDASYSGKNCGPKAANLAQLKNYFPDQVVEGFIIPFGIFKQHMLQKIPGKEISYWDFLMETFDNGDFDANEKAIVERLAELRKLIGEMPLQQDFVLSLENRFEEVFGAGIGNVPVFLRSDTNMEDLKEFTGAGLNLTLFNVLDKQTILKGIRDVWASPYTERSYQWRQKLISNPQHVYPSILVIPSVFVDYSGVVITKDIRTGARNQSTLAFSRGAGGAVDGQKAETWITMPYGSNLLVSPAREWEFRKLSTSGGSGTEIAKIQHPILQAEDFRNLSGIIRDIEMKMPGAGMSPPYDIELGFENGKLWLFQIRPFVENKRALAVDYLESIRQKNREVGAVPLDHKIAY